MSINDHVVVCTGNDSTVITSEVFGESSVLWHSTSSPSRVCLR